MQGCCNQSIRIGNYTKFATMAQMMDAFLMDDTKNTIAMPFILDIDAVPSAPLDFIRILDTGGENIIAFSCILLDIQ